MTTDSTPEVNPVHAAQIEAALVAADNFKLKLHQLSTQVNRGMLTREDVATRLMAITMSLEAELTDNLGSGLDFILPNAV